MRTSILRCAGFTSAAAVLVLIVRASCFADGAPQQPPVANPKADELVRNALQAEADGKPELRADYLKQALAADPNSAAAHWQNGEIRSGNRWLNIDAAAKQAAHDGKVDEYRKVRDQTPATADDQLALARWCAKQNLKDQERTHLLYALQLNPGSKEAISKLGLVRYEGTLVPASEVDKIKEQLRQAKLENKEWKERISKLRRRLDDHLGSTRADVLAEIRDIKDVDAIPSLQTQLRNTGSDVTLAIIECLRAMPQQQATNSLLRIAVFGHPEDVRTAATQALKYRSIYETVPILLANLRNPISVNFATYGRSNYNLSNRLTLSQEGAEDKTLSVKINNTSVGVVRDGDPERGRSNASRAIGQAAAQQQQAALATAARVDSINQQTQAMNDRIVEVLQNTTGKDIESDANAWWDWWYDYNEFYRPIAKPTYTTVDTQQRYQTVGCSSCFVAGTPVWTVTGKMPIESVKIGELVLSQSVETGELSYRPVFLTTVRPPSRLVEIHTGNTVIRVTRGHPFWVDGIGWQMAKELKAGQYLHTVNGPALIDTVEENGEETCYNMVVADFNSYFVSDAKVLVHDNNLRSPTAAIVPGLVQR